MKQVISIILIALMFSSCKTLNLNAEFKPEGKKPYLIGKINKIGFQSETYTTWFNTNYKNYKLDLKTIEAIKSHLKEYDIKLFMGTWCGDSKREVPKFYKILDATNYPIKQLTAVAVSREPNLYKESPQHEEAGLNIVRVPTFIFFKDGKEVNRIIERPIETLEKDILKIIRDNDYKPNYFGIKKKSKKSKNL
ncbi:MAG: thiol reductase thioredoxin [Winogradskyella sp.]|uniref:thioredoxin family protein n=1 Tax=Winogradskyella sp. TaxID=1883156 RepID=UPI001810BFAF|nr:thioredoxin family protein [Winogradskyella sp.]MBT8244359.1 thioredoxin family protein [Winogradskyella sp.]NNK23115.1 thiol reductase thioredoxin [Winogradskyella sp.]